jgi:hypothetical protein
LKAVNSIALPDERLVLFLFFGVDDQAFLKELVKAHLMAAISPTFFLSSHL